MPQYPRLAKITILAAICFVYVLLVAATVKAGTEQKTSVIDSSGPVAISQCVNCHQNLDDFKNDRLIFSHGDHFPSGAGCPACHTSFPHSQEGTRKPTMDTCMNCHNLHGTLQESMQTDCRECHPASMNLRPGFHVPTAWTENLHVRSAQRDVKYCLTCHKESSCRDCHVARGVKELPSEFYRARPLDKTEPRLDFTIDTEAEITISACRPCHGDIDAFKRPGLIFKHDAHFAKGVKCFSCHQEWPHRKNKIIRPSMDLCYGCHGLTHSGNGVVAPENCDLCHPPGFQLKPATHTEAFVSGTHKDVVEESYFTCMTCHDDKEFCAPCHTTKQVIPPAHKRGMTGVQTASNPNWLRSHGKNIDYDYCALCHDNQFCTSCHRTQMPHNVLFVGTHKDYARGMRQECSICHKDEGACSDCHHEFEPQEILVASACEGCHEEVNKPLLEVGSKGLMVHKAHFEMTNTSPFECSKCHAASYANDKRCFQFELCYSCHGRYRADKLIAKWPGSQLCYRCHPQNR